MDIKILPQPDDVTCGPTSLHAVYAHFNYHVPLETLIQEIEFLEEGGTLSYNLRIFDPTWIHLSMPKLRKKLEARYKEKKYRKLRNTIKAYIRFIDQGGIVTCEELRGIVFERYFNKNIPVLCGLSATYLYRCPREYTNENNRSVFDDITGDPMGHFVVVYGIDDKKRFLVADPDSSNPSSKGPYYHVHKTRLIHSILLGVVTYDSNMLVIEPEQK